MAENQQSRRFTALHDRLTNLHHLTEQSRNDLIALRDHTKQMTEEVNQDWNDYTANAIIDNVVDKVIFEQKEKLLTAFLEALGELTSRVQSYAISNADVYNRVCNLMESMMEQYDELFAAITAEADEILERLENEIAQAAQEVHQSSGIMQEFEEELNALADNYRQQAANITPDMPFDVFFSMTKDQMSEEMQAEYEQKFNILHFFIDVFKPWHTKAKEALLRLRRQLYPQFNGYTDTTIERYLDNANAKTANDLLLQLFTLVQEQAEGVIITEKYGKDKIEEWRAFYCRPEQPHLLTTEDRKLYHNLNDEEWEAQMKQENEEIWCYHNWEEERKAIWYDAIQPLNFAYLPDLNELEGDYWVMYAMDLRDGYETWKLRMEHVETVLDYDMDHELLFAPYEEFQNVLSEKYKLHWQEVQAKRDRMILGERKQ